MKEYSYEMHLLVCRLRWKYRDNRRLNDTLDKILWHSIPIVYTNYYVDAKIQTKALEKQKMRRWRVRKYLRAMLERSQQLYLATFTFSDDELLSTTKKRYVRDWLNKNTTDYYACVDFGKEKGREHYHAIISVSFDFLEVSNKRGRFLDLPSSRSWSYGYSSFRPIKGDVVDAYKSLGYVVKASDYAFKNANSDIKPFHKRGGWRSLADDSFI